MAHAATKNVNFCTRGQCLLNLCCVKQGKGKIIPVFNQLNRYPKPIFTFNNSNLKTKALQFLQFIIFLSIGVGVFYWLYKDQDLTTLSNIIRNQVNFNWIWLSLAFGVIAHLTRALRWRMLIEAAEAPVKWYNAFMAVLIGYLANLLFPRMGEVTRCGVVSKYEKLSFTRMAGTVLAERLTDFIFLMTLIFVAMMLEYEMLGNLLSEKLSFAGLIELFTSVWWWLSVVAMVGLIWYIMRRAVQMTIFRKVKGLWEKFREGFLSIRNLKNRWLYLALSIGIWVMYLMMQYVCFFSMQETASLSLKVGLILLVTGSIGMLAPVQGGIGPWHAMVIATLALYGVTHEPAFAFALVVHGMQNLLVIILGLISFVILPFVNKPLKAKE